MSTDNKRFTIAVTPEMETELDGLKQEKYYNTTRNRMIQDLIKLGLKASKNEQLILSGEQEGE